MYAASFLALLASLISPGDSWFAAETVGPKIPLELSVSAPPGMNLIPGITHHGVVVLLKNSDPDVAVALRTVKWKGGAPISSFHSQQQGRTLEKRDGTIELDPLAKQLTEHFFEMALLLPGEEIGIPLPLPVQPGKSQEFIVEYAVVGNDIRRWRSEVFLPEKESLSQSVFRKANTASLERRRLKGGGKALARSTMKEGYLPLGEGQMVFRPSLKISSEAAGETGGITTEEAVRVTGMDSAEEVAFFFDSSRSVWLLVRIRDGAAFEVRRKRGEVVSRSIGLGWSPEAPSRIDYEGEGRTRILLHPDIFGDLVRVRTPTYDLFFDPGETTVRTRDLGKVLDLAAEMNIALRLITVDPNSLGSQPVLSLGVKVDRAGRWVDPPLSPDGD